MNTKTKPHFLLTLYRPDEVAETMSGVLKSPSGDLYNYLWEELMPLLGPAPNNEDNGPELVEGDTVSALWDRIPEERRIELNAIAVLNED